MRIDNPIYVVISPVRDEAAHIEGTIRSVLNQTIRPSEWIIVDDGSTDNTFEILQSYAKQHSWIQVIHRDNRGFRKPGGGVVETVNDGLRSLKVTDWQYIVKLDGDLIFDCNYFAKCLEYFIKDDHLGIGGGTLYYVRDGKPYIEKNPRFHVRGPTKIYRRECWEAIGGLCVAPGWDTVDEVTANMYGWRTLSFPDVLLQHQRRTGTAEGTWKDSVKLGRARYVSSYHPLFLTGSCLVRLFRRPHMAAVGIMYGYLSGYILGLPRTTDPRFVRYVRKQQLRRLFGMSTIWR